MKRLHIIVITIFFNKMSVTGGVCYFLACELQFARGSKLQEFYGDTLASMTFQVNTKN